MKGIKIFRMQDTGVSNVAIEDSHSNIQHKRFVPKKVLNDSSNAKTVVCYDNENKRTVVVKKIPKNVKPLDRFLDEISAQASVSSPGIIETYQAYEDEDSYVVVMEAGKTSLMDIISHGRLSEQLVHSLLPNVLVGLQDLHHNNIVHNDVKPENIVLCQDGKMKLIDFDLATFSNEHTKPNGVFGTWPYMAPEVIEGAEHTEKVDVWSIGVVFFVALTGILPFEARNQQEYLQNVKTQPMAKSALVDVHCSQKLISLISWMLTKDPSKRPTISECLHHEWFTNPV